MALKFVISNPEGSRLSYHNKAMKISETYRRCEAELLKVISVIDEKQIYLDMEIPSLFQYCVEMLRLSPHTASNFITVSRKAKEIPQILESIEADRTSVSKIRKICSVINEKNAKIWIGLTEECSTRVVEKCVAMANPRARVPEILKYISEDTLQFQLAVSEEWSELLAAVKDLLSQKNMCAVTSEEALFIALSDYKRKHDPVLKAERAKERAARKSSIDAELVSEQADPAEEFRTRGGTALMNRVRRIPTHIIHKVNQRDQNRCSYIDRHGTRCTQTRWLEKHHVKHFADGGQHTAENLQTLCWGHHCMMHRHE